jgi:hypothetical protein
MKKIFIVATLGATLIDASVDTRKITNMILKVKQERVGISLEKLESTVNPFIMNVKKEKKVKPKTVKSVISKRVIAEPVYTLDAILNRAAFINKKWYKEGDKLGMYTVDSMGKRSVLLKSKSGEKTLFIKNKKKNFIQLNQGNK